MIISFYKGRYNMNNKYLKHNAKLSLKKKYGQSILIVFLYTIITTTLILILNHIYPIILNKLNIQIPSTLNKIIPSIITIFITSLFYFGQLSFFIQISRNQKTSIKELFKKTDMWLGYICITLITTLFIYLWSLLFIIPGIIAIYNYQLVYYIKADSPHISTLETIRYSKDLMKGNRFKFFKLQLSFIGWIFLGILTIGIGFLWINPYIQVTFANFYNSLLPEREPLEKNKLIKNYYNTVSTTNTQNQNINQNNNTNNYEIPTWNTENINKTINNNINNTK